MDTDTDTDTDTLHLHWVSADCQASIYGGEFPIDVDRDEAEAAFLNELLDQAGDAEAEQAIRDGAFRWHDAP